MSIKIVENNQERFYQINDNLYPSVNNILEKTRSTKAKKTIENWRKKTSLAMQQAVKDRGDYVHQEIANFFKTGILIEHLDNPPQFEQENPQNYWSAIYTALKYNSPRTLVLPDKRNAIEFPLVNQQLKYGGTPDWLGHWNDILTLVDFKTSNKPKQITWLKNYRLQLAAYRLAIKENYNIDIPEVRIVIGVKHNSPQIFYFKDQDLVDDEIAWKNKVKKYYEFS